MGAGLFASFGPVRVGYPEPDFPCWPQASTRRLNDTINRDGCNEAKRLCQGEAGCPPKATMIRGPQQQIVIVEGRWPAPDQGMVWLAIWSLIIHALSLMLAQFGISAKIERRHFITLFSHSLYTSRLRRRCNAGLSINATKMRERWRAMIARDDHQREIFLMLRSGQHFWRASPRPAPRRPCHRALRFQL